MRYIYEVSLIGRPNPIRVKSNTHIDVILKDLVGEKFIILDDKIFNTTQIQAITLLLDTFKKD